MFFSQDAVAAAVALATKHINTPRGGALTVSKPTEDWVILSPNMKRSVVGVFMQTERGFSQTAYGPSEWDMCSP